MRQYFAVTNRLFIAAIAIACIAGCKDSAGVSGGDEDSTGVGGGKEELLALPLRDRVVFASNRQDSLFDIYAVKTDGTDLRRLTNSDHGEFCPAVSPDGNWIVYYREEKNWSVYRFYLMLMKANGSESRVIMNVVPPNHGEKCPQWSNDSKRFLFPNGRNQGDVFYILVFDISGRLVWSGTDPNFGATSLSPDGSSVAITSFTPVKGPAIDYKIRVISENGAVTQSIAGSEPSWSPSGSQIAYSCVTSGVPQLTGICMADKNLTTTTKASNAPARAIHFAPDGSMLSYLCQITDPYAPRICFATKSGEPIATAWPSGVISLSGGMWSQESSFVVFECGDSKSPDICTVKPDGSAFANLTNNSATDRTPSVTPASGR